MSTGPDRDSADRIRLVQWVGEDDPRRIDAATVQFRTSGMRAFGMSRADRWATSWSLECAADWTTRRLQVTAQGFGWSRGLVLERSGPHWTSEIWTWGRPDGDLAGLPDPGIADAGSLEPALDCDLGLCPLTNTMPIRRLDLLAADRAEQLLVMAWVDVPSLAVVASAQRYSSHTVDGRRVVRYESEARDFRSNLEVDQDGLVVRYPQLAGPLTLDEHPRS